MIARVFDLRGAFLRLGMAFAVLAGVIIVELGEAAAIARSRTGFALAPVGALVVWLFSRRPLVAYLAVVIGASTFAYVGAWPSAAFHGINIYLAEAILGGALFARLFLIEGSRQSRSTEGTLVAVLLAAVFIGVFVGVSQGSDAHTALLATRAMFFYAAFWLARPLLSRSKTRRITLTAIATVAIGVVLLVVIQVVVGPSHHLFLAGSTSSQVLTIQSQGSGTFFRVRPPGTTLIYVACAFAIAYLCWGPARRRLAAAALSLTMLAGIAFSLNRNMLIGLALGLCVAAIVVSRSARGVVILASAAIIAVSVGTVVGTSGGSSGGAFVDRVVSIGNWSQLQKQTLSDRYYENHLAVKELKAHPLTGIGWGNSYGATIATTNGVVNRDFIHNQYLGIWLRAGLLGVVAIVAVLLTALRAGVKWARTSADEAWLGAGIIVSLVALAASSTVGMYMTDSDSIVPFVTVLALAAALHNQMREEAR